MSPGRQPDAIAAMTRKERRFPGENELTLPICPANPAHNQGLNYNASHAHGKPARTAASAASRGASAKLNPNGNLLDFRDIDVCTGEADKGTGLSLA